MMNLNEDAAFYGKILFGKMSKEKYFSSQQQHLEPTQRLHSL